MTGLQEVRNCGTRELPPGWRQGLALGCALLHRQEILFLDEPTSGVDPITRQHFWDFIRQLAGREITVFVTTHYMDEARHCGRIVMINEGRVVAMGSPPDIIAGACPGQPNADLNDAFVALMGVSLTGLSPMAGFVGKFFLFAAVIREGGMFVILAVVAILNSVISLLLRPYCEDHVPRFP